MAESGTIDLASPILDDVLPRIGQVTAEWTKLDYVLRIVCKRLENVSLDSDRGRTILNYSHHCEVVDAIKKALNNDSRNENKDKIIREIDKIGVKRNEGLYGRRNKIIHGLYYRTKEGDVFFRRVGESGNGPEKIVPSEIEGFVGELQDIWEELLRLVPNPSNGGEVGTTEVSLAP